DWLEEQLQSKNVPVHRGVKVEMLRWKRGAVSLDAQTADGKRTFEATRAIITLPLGVLKSGDVKFDPEVVEKKEAIQGLEMGQVVKLTLQFRSHFWPSKIAVFIHASEEPFPTWWTHEAVNSLTGWAGGAKAEQLAAQGEKVIIEKALQTAGRIFEVPVGEVANELENVYL